MGSRNQPEVVQSENLSARAPLPYTPERMERLLDRVLNWLADSESGSDLYDTLKNYIGMSDDEIKEATFSLDEFFESPDETETQGMTMM